jgi:hypothetical protein
MLGFNGGLIGKNNPTVAGTSIPGMWTSREQEVAVRRQQWAGAELLDFYPGATAAYSLRTIKASASLLPVVRVRRSSGAPSEENFTSTQITDGTLASFCAGTDGFVSVWYDQSGSGNNAVQASAGNQPRIVSNGVVETDTSGGKPAIIFGSGFSLTISPTITTASNCAFFTVTRNTNSSGTWAWIIGWGGTGDGMIIGKEQSTTNIHYFFAGATGGTTISGTNIVQKTIGYWQQGSGISQYKINLVTGSLLSGSKIGNFQIGNTFGQNEFWNGPIQEIIYYPTSQVSTNSAIMTNINTYYSVY